MGVRVLQIFIIVGILLVVIGLFSFASARIMGRPLTLNIFRRREPVSPLVSPTPTANIVSSPVATTSATLSPSDQGKWDVPSEYAEPVVVHVLNGTDDPEVAESMMEKIEREFGYEVGSTGEASSDEYRETIIMDLDEADEWPVSDFARQLNADVGNVRVTDKFSVGDFVVIVGEDYQQYLRTQVQ